MKALKDYIEKEKINIEEIARKTIKEIGYGNENLDINPDTCEVDICISKQSTDIAVGVDGGRSGRSRYNVWICYK